MINGEIIQKDRKAHRQGARAKRGKPTRIIWEDKTEPFSFGAEIDGTLRVICRPCEEPFIEVDGTVRSSDPKAVLRETQNHVYVYVDQGQRKINKKLDIGVPAIVARWSDASRYAGGVVIEGYSEIAYGR
jgi:hypothetical protein